MTLDLPRDFGPYRLRARLGRGGMAEVFLASHETVPGMPRLVALKLIRPQLLDDPDFVEMFLDEGRILAGLYHPNLDHVVDVGEVDGRPYLALDYVPGRDLAFVLRRHEGARGTLPVDLATQVVTRVAAGLAHAHGRRDRSGRSLGIVHRDVSPENVIVTFAGTVKLVDFGIARGAMRAQVTEPGLVKGKPAYMAPEQLLAQALDARTDVFALGVLLYRLACGRHPFGVRSDDASTYARLLREAPAPPHLLCPDVPEDLSVLLLQALAREPEGRPQSADALVDGLEAVMRRAGWFPSERRLAGLMAELFPQGAVAAERLAQDPLDLSAAHTASWLSTLSRAAAAAAEVDARLAAPAPELGDEATATVTPTGTATETETAPAGATRRPASPGPPAARPPAATGFLREAPDALDAADTDSGPEPDPPARSDRRLARPAPPAVLFDETSLSGVETGPSQRLPILPEESTTVDPAPPSPRPPLGPARAAAPTGRGAGPPPAASNAQRAPATGPRAAPRWPVWRQPLPLAVTAIAVILVGLVLVPLVCGR